MFAEHLLGHVPGALNLALGPNAGPPLLLLHGVARCWRDWLTLMPGLAARWQVLALDFRGHGRSGRTPGRYRVGDYVEDALAVVRHRFAEPGVLFGHSLGALVALGVAAATPELVRAVVLEDPPAPAFLAGLGATPYHAQFAGMQPLAGAQRPVAELAAALADLRIATAAGAQRLGALRDAASLRFSARCLQDLDPEVFVPLLACRWLDGVDLPAWAEGVTCPVLLLHGNEQLGGMLSGAGADALVGKLADATRVDLPHVGHLIHVMEPDTTLRLVVQFLESVR